MPEEERNQNLLGLTEQEIDELPPKTKVLAKTMIQRMERESRPPQKGEVELVKESLFKEALNDPELFKKGGFGKLLEIVTNLLGFGAERPRTQRTDKDRMPDNPEMLSEHDIAEYDHNIQIQIWGARIDAHTKDLTNSEKDNLANSQVVSEFKRFKKWIRIVRDNRKENNALTSAEEDRRLEEIDGLEVESLTTQQILNLKDELIHETKLDKYFEGLAGSREWREILYQPQNLDELLELIMTQDEPEFRRGGRYQLVDYEGKIHVENFYGWVRKRIQELHYGNPVTPIDTYSGIYVRTQMSQVGMAEMLILKKYFQTTSIRITGDKDNPTAVHTDAHAHEDFGDNTKNIFWLEMVVGKEAHDMNVEYLERRSDIKGIGETLGTRYNKNRFTSGNRMLNIMKLNQIKTREEFIQFRDGVGENAEGPVGKAIRRMLLAHYYISEIAMKGDHHATFDKNPDGTERNMFIEAMGGKDSENLRTFYLSLDASALGTRAEFKNIYRQFLVETLEKEKRDNPSAQDIIDRHLNNLQRRDNDGNLLDYTDEIRLDYIPLLEQIRVEAHQKRTKKEVTDQELGDIRRDIKAKSKDNVKDNFINKLRGKLGKEIDGVGDLTNLFDVDNDRFTQLLTERLLSMKRSSVDAGWNIYSLPNGKAWFIPMMNKAISDGACEGLNLEALDSQHAKMYVETFVHWMGIAGKNDIEGVGFDVQGKAINLMANRERIAQGRGSQFEQNLFGFQHVMLNFPEAMKLQMDQGYMPPPEADLTPDEIKKRKEGMNVTLLELIQGGQGNQINLDKPLGKYHFENQAEANYLATHISPAIGLVNFLTAERDLHMADFFKTDQFGNLLFDHVKAEGILKGVYGPVRAAFETFAVDMTKKMRVPMLVMKHDHDTGKVVNHYEFKEVSVMEYCFNDELRNMGMYDRVSNKPEDKNRRVARNALAYVVGKEIMEHRLWETTHHRWSISNIVEIERFFAYLSADKVAEHEHNGVRHVTLNEKFFTREEWEKILGLFNSSYGKMYLTEFAIASISGLGEGFLKAMLTLGKESFQSALKG